MKQSYLEYEIIFNSILAAESLYPTSRQKFHLTCKLIDYLDNWHFSNNSAYRNMVLSDGSQALGVQAFGVPVRLFKQKDLISLPKNKIIKTMLSSGTTGQQQAKIYLDKNTARNQSLILSRIMSDLLGSKRQPMLIIDSERIAKDRTVFSARTAGIRGFSIFGKDVHFALDENLDFNKDVVVKFFNKYKDQPKLVFGFTFLVWQKFVKKIRKLKNTINFEGSTVLHGGGWKNIESKKVSRKEFKKAFLDLNFKSVHDYYGMVEQTGSIFIECNKGYFHSNIFNDIKVIDPLNLREKEYGEAGLISLESIAPLSYPGHRILTEDIGIIFGEDNCSCGRSGKFFKVNGRLPKSEIRGCSNVIQL